MVIEVLKRKSGGYVARITDKHGRQTMHEVKHSTSHGYYVEVGTNRVNVNREVVNREVKGGRHVMSKCIKSVIIISHILLVVLLENMQKIYNTFKMFVLIFRKDYKKAYYTTKNGKLHITLIY